MPTEMFWRSDGWLFLTTRTFPDSVFPNSSARLDVVYIKVRSGANYSFKLTPLRCHWRQPQRNNCRTQSTQVDSKKQIHPWTGLHSDCWKKKCGTRGKRGPFSRERGKEREREHRRTKERKSEALQGDHRCYHNMFHYYSSFTVFSSSLSIFSFALTLHSAKFLLGDDCEWKKHRTTHTLLGYFLDHRKRSTMPEEFGSKEK